jgi:hypothetical protein
VNGSSRQAAFRQISIQLRAWADYPEENKHGRGQASHAAAAFREQQFEIEMERNAIRRRPGSQVGAIQIAM